MLGPSNLDNSRLLFNDAVIFNVLKMVLQIYTDLVFLSINVIFSIYGML